MQQLLSQNWAQNLARAQTCLDAAKRSLRRNYTGAADVSWTQPPHLLPYVYVNEADKYLAGLDRWSTAAGPGPLRPLRPPREVRRVEFLAPRLFPVDVRTNVRNYGDQDEEGDVNMGGT